ncbi:hypothetical protein TA3x_001314 [Tundrisphaera sp. TA3]|uniref:hypothetical protein n=1 Tax=Tundrisphaera sp. TA3 TaxID=3435775 RepID=UPI003EBD58F0
MDHLETREPAVETDDRFPTGAWTGFFLQPSRPGRHWMELDLTFREGRIEGEGRDSVGAFRVTGRYAVEDGVCRWTKTYIGEHSLSYLGYNEGKGIWGNWEMTAAWRGGFHVWPVAMGDPTLVRRAESVEEPISFSDLFAPEGEPCEVGAPVGAAVGEPFGSPVDDPDPSY